MTWQRIKNVNPGLNTIFLLWMRGAPYYAKRFVHEGRDLIVFSMAYSSVTSDDPKVLMRNNTPSDFYSIKHSKNNYLWRLFDAPELDS